ncbi:hypothetical protein RJD05_06005 [Ralstonia sp. 11b]|uniref:hypothetical protein n=1 Tax=Ralstonia sp. 11b TaxID=3063544 RepID=UPI0028706173|nr:hypothetical protein [Ralstonia sp. 11b]MDR9383919.1 hypothetical protein [Ralstonia sp. 11b]
MNDFVNLHGALVGSARLMNPQEIQGVLAARRGGPNLRPGWCLCGDVTKDMFELFAGPGCTLRLRLSGFFGPSQGSYAVLTQQVRDLQHRFLLPLYEPDAVAFLKALRDQPLQVMLAREGGELAVVGHQYVEWRDVVPLVAMASPCQGGDIHEVMLETAEAVRYISGLDAIPSAIPEIAVRLASVSYLSPDDFCVDTLRG